MQSLQWPDLDQKLNEARNRLLQAELLYYLLKRFALPAPDQLTMKVSQNSVSLFHSDGSVYVSPDLAKVYPIDFANVKSIFVCYSSSPHSSITIDAPALLAQGHSVDRDGFSALLAENLALETLAAARDWYGDPTDFQVFFEGQNPPRPAGPWRRRWRDWRFCGWLHGHVNRRFLENDLFYLTAGQRFRVQADCQGVRTHMGQAPRRRFWMFDR